MNDNEKLIRAIFDAVDDINGRLPDARKLGHSRDTVLFGESGNLDSLGLVHLIVAVEQRIEDTLGVAISLADEKAMSQRTSPFRTIGTLADYAIRLVEERSRG